MTQEFFKSGATVAVVTLDNPFAEDDEELITYGYVVERDHTGILIDTRVEDVGQVYIPWFNIAHISAVDFTQLEQNVEPEDGMTY